MTKMAQVLISLTSIALGLGSALASTPTVNDLGFGYKIMSLRPTTTVEIRLKPTRSFDTVTVEAASGVASLTPSCGFSGVVAGGSYVCRVDVAGKPADAAMTLSIVASRAEPGGAVPQTEIHHLTLANSSFVRSARRAARSKHVLTSSSAARK
jgi:hypothetical protein